MTPEQREPDYYHDQNMLLKTTAASGNLVISKQLKTFNFYTGLKAVLSSSTMKATGLYPQRNIRPGARSPYYEFYFNDVYDPINTQYTNTHFGINAGLQLKLKAFVWQVEGVWSRYKTLGMSVGFGL